MANSDSVLDELYAVIESRKGGDPEKSYTAKKFAKGTDHIAKKIGEEAKISVRNIRRDCDQELKKFKEQGVSEDEVKRKTDDLQKLTDKYTKEIDDAVGEKEKEIMEF